jgi:hypothetical protein
MCFSLLDLTVLLDRVSGAPIPRRNLALSVGPRAASRGDGCQSDPSGNDAIGRQRHRRFSHERSPSSRGQLCGCDSGGRDAALGQPGAMLGEGGHRRSLSRACQKNFRQFEIDSKHLIQLALPTGLEPVFSP